MACTNWASGGMAARRYVDIDRYYPVERKTNPGGLLTADYFTIDSTAYNGFAFGKAIKKDTQKNN